MPNIVNTTRSLEMSDFARRTINPHRIMVESSKVKPNPKKELITLQLGEFELKCVKKFFYKVKMTHG